jgi:hypothetical protein
MFPQFATVVLFLCLIDRESIMFAKKVKTAGFLLSLLLVSACGSGGGSGVAITPPVSGQTSVQASTSGVTAAPVTVSLGSATVSVPASTTLKAADGTPVTGDVKVAATYGSNSVYLPATEQTTLPAGQSLKGYVSINITGDQKVKTVTPPIPVAVSVPLADGTPVTIYSNSEGAGDTWVKEGSATVSGGKVSFEVSHFTVYAIFQQNVTGGTSGGTTQQ